MDGVAIDDTAASVLTGFPGTRRSGTLAGEQAGGYAITQGTLAANAGLHDQLRRQYADDHPGGIDGRGQSADQGLRHGRSDLDQHGRSALSTGRSTE